MRFFDTSASDNNLSFSQNPTEKHGVGDTVTLVDVDVDAYRRKLDNRAVRKNLTVPFWLNEQAERAGINFSCVLQEALKQKLGY